MPDPRIAKLGYEAVTADREARRQRTLRDKKACALYELYSGEKLPEVHSIRDPEGNLWELSVIATVRLVERGGTDE